jgi:hypothetical protein
MFICRCEHYISRVDYEMNKIKIECEHVLLKSDDLIFRIDEEGFSLAIQDSSLKSCLLINKNFNSEDLYLELEEWRLEY